MLQSPRTKNINSNEHKMNKNIKTTTANNEHWEVPSIPLVHSFLRVRKVCQKMRGLGVPWLAGATPQWQERATSMHKERTNE